MPAMTARDALLGYAVDVRNDVRNEVEALALTKHDHRGREARQAGLLLGDAATHSENVDEDLLWSVFERQLARVGQALARHTPDSALTGAVCKLAKTVAANRADAPLQELQRAGFLTEAQRDRLLVTSGALAKAWYCGHPPLKAWRDVEELARLARVQARLAALDVPAGAQGALDVGRDRAKRAADETATRIAAWPNGLTEEDWKSGAALDPGRYPSAGEPRGVWSYGFWLLMLTEALSDSDAVALTDQLATSEVVEAHRHLVEEHTCRESHTPVVALAPAPWLNAAAEAGLSSRGVRGNCWRGYALFLPFETAQRLLAEQRRLDGELLHEMVEDIQGARDEHLYKELRRDEAAECLREGGTEAVTQELLRRSAQPPRLDEQVGYPAYTAVAEEVAKHLGGDDPLRPLLQMLATENSLAWLVGRCSSCSDAEEQLVGALEDANIVLGGPVGLLGGPVTRAQYDASRTAHEAALGDLRAVLQNCCK